MQLLTFVVHNHQFNALFKSGVWDGKKRFYRIYKDKLIMPKGVAQLVISKLAHYNITYEPIQHDVYIPSLEEFQEFVDSLGVPFNLHDFQFQSAFDSIVFKRQTNILATSAGKSLVQYIIARWMYKQGLKFVLIVPSILLVEQMKSDWLDYTSKEKDKAPEETKAFFDSIHLIGGDNKIKNFESPVTITTWQSVYNSPKLFSDVKVLVVDECHGVKASSFSDIIIPSATNTIYRLGFTGTLPNDIVDTLEIITSMGPKKVYVTSQDLIERGLATPVEIVLTMLNYSSYEANQIRSMKYQRELKYFYNHIGRHIVVSKLIKKLSEYGNVLVLFDRIELVENLINVMYPGIDSNLFRKKDNLLKTFLITGSTKPKDRVEIVNHLELCSNNIVFGTESILSTGVSVKNLHYMVSLSSGGRSAVRIIQSIGRLLRLHHSKQKVKLYDIIDYAPIITEDEEILNYSVKHMNEKVENIYRQSGFPISVLNIPVNNEKT